MLRNLVSKIKIADLWRDGAGYSKLFKELVVS